MKNVIAWIKSNPLSVASLVVILLSLGAMGYFMFMANPALRALAEKQPKADINQIRGYSTKSIEVPPANADDPPETVSPITINAATIEVLDQIYSDLAREGSDIIQAALAINQPGHTVLVEGLFPETPSPLRFPAKRAYEDILAALVADKQRADAVAKDTGHFVPYLNAGNPLEPAYVQSELDQNRSEALQGRDISTMTEQRRVEFRAEQQRELLNLLLRHAETINIYANPNLGSILQPNKDFPLQVSSLGTTPESPSPAQLWEGQIELWILQDIVRAIGLTNRIGETYTNDKGEVKPYSVLQAPIKRLIRAEVLPGYVGLHTTGGVNTLPPPTGAGGSSGSAGVAPKVVATFSPAVGYPPPAGGMTNQPKETKLPENFLFGPTGRSSNNIYDVRHAHIKLHADFQRLPELFNALAQVNLMTVIDCQVRDVDEYEMLANLYAYGTGDIVEVDMIVETIWFREWTAPLMPEDVKIYMGLLPPKEGTPATDPYGMPGGFGGYPGGYPGGGGPEGF